MAAFEGWAVVELLGHRVRYGRVSEVTMFGEAMLRVEMPTDPPTEEFYAGKALYGIKPASEERIRAYHAPRRALTAGVLEGEVVVDDNEWGGDDEPDVDGDDPEIRMCGGCRMSIRFGEPTAEVQVDEDGPATWHESCAKANAEHVAAPLDKTDSENPL